MRTDPANPLVVSSVSSRFFSWWLPTVSLTGQKEPSLSGGEKPLLISRVAVGLRNLLFGLGVAFTARKHFNCWSDKGMPEFLLGCLCNIDHAGPLAPSQPPSFIGMSVERGKRRRW